MIFLAHANYLRPISPMAALPQRMLHGHTLSNTSAADPFDIGSVEMDEKVFLLSYIYPFQCGRRSKIPLEPGNILPSGYYAWDT